MRDDPAVVALVTRAADGDQGAWSELVERYAPLVWSICARYRLTGQDSEDVGQNVWLRLVEHLGNLREPAALPGWLATTTQRECLRVVRAAARYDHLAASPDELPPGSDAPVVEEEIIAAELNAALRAAFDGLPARCRQLLSMLVSDPPHSYAEISRILGMPAGSIGPERGRCLHRLRCSGVLAAFLHGGASRVRLDIAGGDSGA
jgi:RNA polymerase sigma factor (sigma-70 family)